MSNTETDDMMTLEEYIEENDIEDLELNGIIEDEHDVYREDLTQLDYDDDTGVCFIDFASDLYAFRFSDVFSMIYTYSEYHGQHALFITFTNIEQETMVIPDFPLNKANELIQLFKQRGRYNND